VSTETIDLRAAARELGVHYQTAYRLVRTGELPAALVNGAYRLQPEAVTRLAERRACPAAPPRRRPRAGFAGLSERIYGHLAAGEERQAALLVGGLVRDGVPMTTVAQEVIVPALRRIGEQWRAGHLEISVEHRASAIVERILGEHYPNPRGRRRGTAVVATLEGDRHALPTTLAATALREDNWLVQHLGADLPPRELIRFCEQEPPDLVVLSVTIARHRRTAARTAARLQRLGLRVLVGGPGQTLEELQQLARGPRAASPTGS
jgi:excisionase family DNA binding protein